MNLHIKAMIYIFDSTDEFVINRENRTDNVQIIKGKGPMVKNVCTILN